MDFMEPHGLGTAMRKSVLGGLVLLALLGGGCASIGGLTGGSAAPAWVLQPPADTAEAWWGVGEGRDRDAAKGAALRDVAARLRVGISGKLDTQVSETNGKVDRRASARVSEEVARTEFRNYTIEQTAQSGKLVHVLVKVDRRAFVTDVRAAIEPLDAAIRQGTANLDSASPIERFVTLRKLGPTLDKASAQAQLLVGAENGGKGLALLDRYRTLQQQTTDAASALVFKLDAKPRDADIATAVGTLMNENGMRADASASATGTVVAITSAGREDEMSGSKLVKLDVTLAVRDDRGQSVATRTYQVSGASRLDHGVARQNAIRSLLEAMRAEGPVAALGFAR